MDAKGHYVYMIECGDGSLYTGYAVDVKARLARHRAGKGAKYTRGRGPFILRYEERLATCRDALRREIELKSWSKAKKWELIRAWESRREADGHIATRDAISCGHSDR
ncbi:GIY-YIG nuclease family protein [Bacillaceae bacterium SIJ1]|uniref:GIY-YIG nuclease family protein n=1 Tax=Litoribacterium kuwaitense TaxID=1398745 RepID=UPI0013EC6718|nr:GIY-YIG nuclease family protein [Litoribacterium kuwaitense]NGP45786.1 GIY-YIG nuclease family protein [Litoribacterium kuwaitense]